MKYFENKINWRHEISRITFYSRARRKNAHITIVTNCGGIVAKILKYY